MSQIAILLKKDLMELYRTKKTFILGIFFLFIGVLGPITAFLMPEIFAMIAKENSEIIITFPEPTYIDSYLNFFKNIGQMGLYILIIIYSSLIVEERQKGMYANLLANKVKYYNFIISKIISQVIVFTSVYIISIVIFGVYTYYLFGSVFAPNFLIAFVSYYVYMILIIGIINLISVIAKTTTSAIALSFLVIFGTMLFDLIPKVGKYLPTHLPSLANQVIKNSDYIKYFYPGIMLAFIFIILIIILSTKLCRNIEEQL